MNAADAAQAVERAFPELAPCEAIAIGHGLDNAAFLVNGAWVFRFAQSADAVPFLENEVRVAPLLAPFLPIPIAAPKLVCRDRSLAPYPFAGHAYIAGEGAERTDDARPYAAQLGAFLRTLHSIDLTIEDPPGDLMGKSDPTRVIARLDRWTAGASDRAAILTHAEQLAGAEEHRSRCWVHGDLYPRHVLIDNGAIAGVIDWGDVHYGDRALDLAIALGWLDDPAPFFDAYGPIDEATLDRARLRALTYGVYFVYQSREPVLTALGARYLRALGI